MTETTNSLVFVPVAGSTTTRMSSPQSPTAPFFPLGYGAPWLNIAVIIIEIQRMLI